MKDRFIIWLVPRIIAMIYYLLLYTIRWEVVGNAYTSAQSARYLYAFWHSRMLLMPHPFRKTPVGHESRRFFGYMLISDHRDGGFIADTMHLLGIHTVRGSSTRGGAKAMLRMIRSVREEGCNLGITPDGPKGPREKVQKGTVQLSMKANLPVVPVCYASKQCWRINSWDRFYIPKPFTKGVFVFGEPVTVHPDDDINEALKQVQQAMDATQDAADHYFERNHT